MKKYTLFYVWIISILLQILAIITKWNFFIQTLYLIHLFSVLTVIPIKAVRNTIKSDAAAVIMTWFVHFSFFVYNIILYSFLLMVI